MCVCDHCGGSIEAHEPRFAHGGKVYCDAYCFKQTQELQPQKELPQFMKDTRVWIQQALRLETP